MQILDLTSFLPTWPLQIDYAGAAADTDGGERQDDGSGKSDGAHGGRGVLAGADFPSPYH